jgi:sterol desaturase/sphingolipid hydroxylase (fatty acid hydroxylase superfamily)
LVLTMLVSQFGEYIAHRSMHEVPLLWRLHATHHSPGRLYWLNAARFHPIDTALLFFLGTTPLVLLGAPAEMFLLLLVWTSVHGLFQHCNIRLRLGPLNYVFSMAELHRWHHSLKLEEANANYGNNILFWDLVFGTVHYPKDRAASADIGLSDLPDFPKDYLGQVLSPWRWRDDTDQERPPS